MTDRRSTYTRKQVERILGVTDRTLLRWKGKKLHTWPDPDDPSGRRLLYDRSEVDNLARRRQRRGSGSYAIEHDDRADRPPPPPPPPAQSRSRTDATPEPKPPSGPGPDDARRRWERELDERRARGQADFEAEDAPPSRRRTP